MDRFSQRKLTKEKRQNQQCRVFSIKIDRSKLSIKNKEHLEGLFREARWYYNYCVSQKNVNNAETKIKTVQVKVLDRFEDRIFNYLTAQMKQEIKARSFSSIKTLHKLKCNGNKVGKLKFKSIVNSIVLKQFNKTFFVDFKNKKIKIQCLKSWLRVNGLEQIFPNMEIANAVLLRKNKDYYINITTYSEKENKNIPEVSMGIDFGCQTQMTFSNGIKAEFQVPISKRLRRLDRKIMKNNRPKSKNKEKDKEKRRIEYQKIVNKKTYIRHKIVSVITKNYQHVCFQDESIHAWAAGNHGKKIQNSGIGGIIADLKHKSATPHEVSKLFPSTQLCLQCGIKNKQELKDRIYICECGYREDRDLKSAVCIEREGMKEIEPQGSVPMDRRDFKLEENWSSAFFDQLTNINGIKVSKIDSLSQEALKKSRSQIFG